MPLNEQQTLISYLPRIYIIKMSSDEQPSAGIKEHWKSLFAMTLVSLSSFQYGLDFGVIGGLQAMVPFLQVGGKSLSCVACDFLTRC